ncbi:MAG TPA: DivIVA domain-containing protein [Solirubrobacteraceae bacterium]|jgi:DivIVA domain-containing protein|nr:DivIVA domain-containing protein [Solirubrobacteraceae bacterium]
MALDRQSIEKRDFPIGRRGYDPEAVDAHLSEIASQVEELRLTARRHTESLASSASEQVRAIIEAAEASATEILRQAETEAREIRAEAAQEAQTQRSDATTQARDYVGGVSEATAVMLQRLNAMESELSSLIDGLRTGSNRLNADLQLLEGNFEGVRDAVGPRARFESETGGEPLLANEPQPAIAALLTGDGVEAALTDATVVEISEETITEDIEGARLVALNMALNGTPRDETDRYLSENFELEDRQLLLDEVYSSVAD